MRSDGWQIHEGLDIRCLQRDKHGEPTDPVMATADGTVMYVNTHPSLSNYGNYIVIRHLVEGMEIYSLYAHLHSVAEGVRPGQAVVKAGRSHRHHGPDGQHARGHFQGARACAF